MGNLQYWRPIRDTHAIQSAMMAVQFGEPVGEVLFRKIEAQAGSAAYNMGLAERQPLSHFPFPIEINIPGALMAQPERGSLYARREEGNVLEQFTLARDLIQYEQFVYTRWAPFQKRGESLMSAAVDKYGEVSSLVAITSAYHDVFEAIGDNVDVSEIIDHAGLFVAAGSHRSNALWHTHSGFFEYPDEFTRRLVQVNIDVHSGPVPGRPHVIRIVTQTADQFGQPERTALDPDQVRWSFIAEHARQQHQRLKELLAEVLTPAAAHAISLS